MKLRKINEQRYVDDETGTYFDLPPGTNDSEAEEQILLHQRVFFDEVSCGRLVWDKQVSSTNGKAASSSRTRFKAMIKSASPLLSVINPISPIDTNANSLPILRVDPDNSLVLNSTCSPYHAPMWTGSIPLSYTKARNMIFHRITGAR